MAVVHHPAVERPERPAVSICIANYNGERLLADCIESVLAQEGGHDVEIIVHDDASTDGSVALLRERYSQVELLASDENVGFCISNNRMVARARGEYVLLLNNDAALFPDALATLLATARGQDKPGILTLPQYDWITGEPVDRGCLLDPFYNPVPSLDPQRTDVAMAIGACLFLPRELWLELGGFPEWMGSIAEDMYLCCQAKLRGYPVQVIQRSGYRHRQGASFGGNRVGTGRLASTVRRRRLSESNKTATLVICTPSWLVWPLLATHMCLLAFEGAALTVMARDRAIWHGIYAPACTLAWRQRHRLRLLRRQTQDVRITTIRRYLTTFTCLPRKLVLIFRYGWPTIRR